MIKWLICRLWGHKTVVKKYTGETMTATLNGFGDEGKVSLYVWGKVPFCLRCGKDTQ